MGGKGRRVQAEGLSEGLIEEVGVDEAGGFGVVQGIACAVVVARDQEEFLSEGFERNFWIKMFERKKVRGPLGLHTPQICRRSDGGR